MTIAIWHPHFDLSFLDRRTFNQTLAGLEAPSGVGRKVSAPTLNFSTLQLFDFVGPKAKIKIKTVFGVVMAARHGWDAADHAELRALMKRLGPTIWRHHQTLCRDCPITARCKKACGGR